MRSIRLFYCLYLDKRLEDMKILKLKVEKQLADNLKELSTREFFEFSIKAGYEQIGATITPKSYMKPRGKHKL